MTANSSPLTGSRIAVTRPRARSDALLARLTALGADVIEAPAIVFAPPETRDELDAALRDLPSVAWVAFTSATAVEWTVRRVKELGLPLEALARPRLAAIGEATADRVAELVRPPDLVPADARGEALASALAGAVQGVRVLVPRAAEGRTELVEGLALAGAFVLRPAAYRTLPVSPESLEPLAAALRERTVDVVVFASPSAVRSISGSIGPELLRRAALAAIGPTTAAELESGGLEVAIRPETASTGSLVAALVDWFTRRSGGASDQTAVHESR